MIDSKACTKCNETKPLTDFGRAVSARDGLNWKCKVCVRDASKAAYARNPKVRTEATRRWKTENAERNRMLMVRWREQHTEQEIDRRLKRTYGISLDRYNEMFAQQGGHCAICTKHQAELKTALSVDHDHRTGKVRGLLCKACNLALGQFGDSAENIARAGAYLQQSASDVI